MSDILKNNDDTINEEWDAIRIYVRGFQDRTLGEKLAKILEEIGFDLVLVADGESDSEGGLIETYITNASNLMIRTIGEIRDRIYAAADLEVYIQWETYVRAEDSEYSEH